MIAAFARQPVSRAINLHKTKSIHPDFYILWGLFGLVRFTEE